MCDSPEGGEHLEVDALEHVLGRVQLDEEHDEDAMVRQLLELRVAHLVVLEEDTRHDAEHLQRTGGRTGVSTYSQQVGEGWGGGLAGVRRVSSRHRTGVRWVTECTTSRCQNAQQNQRVSRQVAECTIQ